MNCVFTLGLFLLGGILLWSFLKTHGQAKPYKLCKSLINGHLPNLCHHILIPKLSKEHIKMHVYVEKKMYQG